MLAGGRRGAVERHATLRAAIDWSFELLNAAEQHLLARIAVFTGGCTLEAIEEVCSGDPVAREEAMDLVTGLVARSLVVAEESVLGTRYRLLETIRQYGEERLAEWGETSNLLIRHGRFYADLSVRAAEHFYGPDQLLWARQINLEEDNIRSALANAIDTDNTALAVQLAANHPHRHSMAGTGKVFEVPAPRVIKMPNARDEPGYPRVLMAAAWQTWLRGDFDTTDELNRQALEADSSRPTALLRPRIELDACSLTAMASLAAGAYTDAVTAYSRAADVATVDGYPGLAAIFLAVGVNAALLGGGGMREATAQAEEALALARQSGMHAAIVVSLNSLALTLVESDPARARALLQESIERMATLAEASPSGVLTACLAAGRLADWNLALASATRSLRLEFLVKAPLQVAPCLAMCARALAEDRPDIAGVLHGAAYATFKRAASEASSIVRSSTAVVGPNANFVLTAMHETGDIVAAAIGDERRRALRTEGAAMSMDEAIAYALANIDPKLLTGPIASIDR